VVWGVAPLVSDGVSRPRWRTPADRDVTLPTLAEIADEARQPAPPEEGDAAGGPSHADDNAPRG
jgi:hypothetical protein